MKVVALCLLTATTFWILNALNKDNYYTIVDYPIQLVYNDEEFMAVDKLPTRVKVEINGNGWDLLRKYFKVNETIFLVELDNPASKDYLLTSELRRGLAETLSPTSLVSILTDTLKFDIDRIVTRKIKILPDTTAVSLARHFFLTGKIDIDPASVNIKGPTSILQQMDGVLRVGLGEERINRNFNKIIPLVVPEQHKGYLSLEEESVHIKFEVAQYLEGNKRLKIRLDNFPKNASIVGETAIVMMSYLVDERKLDNLKEMEFEAVINYSNRNPADSTINVQVRPRPIMLDSIILEPPIFKIKYD
jgi:YbbR domain-containing protein